MQVLQHELICVSQSQLQHQGEISVTHKALAAVF